MKAKDTVMSAGEFGVLIQHIVGKKFPTTPKELGGFVGVVCRPPIEAQAEISFKAGIREVVEFTKQYNQYPYDPTGKAIPRKEKEKLYPKCGVAIAPDLWQAKIKEWGQLSSGNV